MTRSALLTAGTSPTTDSVRSHALADASRIVVTACLLDRQSIPAVLIVYGNPHAPHRDTIDLLRDQILSGPPGAGSEEGVAHPQRPVAGGAELGELAFDVDVDGAEEVDVLAVCREMWARTSSSMRRPAARICATARP